MRGRDAATSPFPSPPPQPRPQQPLPRVCPPPTPLVSFAAASPHAHTTSRQSNPRLLHGWSSHRRRGGGRGRRGGRRRRSMSLRELSSDTASASASPWRTAATFSSLPKDEKIRAVCLEESDEELFTVPDLEAPPPSSKATSGSAIQHSSSGVVGARDGSRGPAKLRKGRNPQDKECRKLKRLLRNRVSAQQARERKKVYVTDLESRTKELQDHNAKLEEKIFTLVNENTMLRKVLMNMRPKADEGTEPHHDQSNKS